MLADNATTLAKTQLEAALAALEAEASKGRHNTICIRALGNAAQILGQATIAVRAAHLLRAAPDLAFWTGSITNLEPSESITESWRRIDPPEEAGQRHPPWNTRDSIERVRSYAETEEHFALCLNGQVDKALKVAGSGVHREEVGQALAVLGHLDAARRIASDPILKPFRQQGIRFVLLIESYRHGRFAEAEALLAETTSAGLGTWERIHLALGIAGREPWVGYPFPDW